MPSNCQGEAYTGSVQAALLSLDKFSVVRVDVVIGPEDYTNISHGSDMKVSPGSENGACTQGKGRNSGDPYVSFTLEYIGRWGSYRKPPGLERIVFRTHKQRIVGHRRGTVNRVISKETQEEHKEVSATHNTDESGEPDPWDPKEGRGCREHRTAEGNDV